MRGSVGTHARSIVRIRTQTDVHKHTTGRLRSQNRTIDLRLALTLNIQTTIRCAHDHRLWALPKHLNTSLIQDYS